jgi:nucleotide-binding universal stress UspA family protein
MTETKPTIVVCLDTSSNSSIVLQYACQIARQSNFAVQILAVMDSSSKGLLFASRTIEKDKRLQIEKKLKKLIDITTKDTGIIPIISIREGEVVREIAREIKANPTAIMLILGKSYSSQSDNNVLPKLSAQIGSKIQVPVLIVPENLGEEAIKNLLEGCAR